MQISPLFFQISQCGSVSIFSFSILLYCLIGQRYCLNFLQGQNYCYFSFPNWLLTYWPQDTHSPRIGLSSKSHKYNAFFTGILCFLKGPKWVERTALLMATTTLREHRSWGWREAQGQSFLSLRSWFSVIKPLHYLSLSSISNCIWFNKTTLFSR